MYREGPLTLPEIAERAQTEVAGARGHDSATTCDRSYPALGEQAE